MDWRNILRSVKSFIAIRFNLPILYSSLSYAQEGEDLIIGKIFAKRKIGFYVDIGAHHPFRYNNTYLLYKKGWRGINIDPTKGFKKMFDRVRKGDINLELAIGLVNGISNLYAFRDSAFNTMDGKRADGVIRSSQSKPVSEYKVKMQRLDNVLKKYKIKNIDYLNIDAEGMEWGVLNSFRLEKYKPEVLTIEKDTQNKRVENKLKQLGYKVIASTTLTDVYVL